MVGRRTFSGIIKGRLEESHSGLVRPPAKRLTAETWFQGSNPCSSANVRKTRLGAIESGFLFVPRPRHGVTVLSAPTHETKKRGPTVGAHLFVNKRQHTAFSV